jgi:hypothetical protein
MEPDWAQKIRLYPPPTAALQNGRSERDWSCIFRQKNIQLLPVVLTINSCKSFTRPRLSHGNI